MGNEPIGLNQWLFIPVKGDGTQICLHRCIGHGVEIAGGRDPAIQRAVQFGPAEDSEISGGLRVIEGEGALEITATQIKGRIHGEIEVAREPGFIVMNGQGQIDIRDGFIVDADRFDGQLAVDIRIVDTSPGVEAKAQHAFGGKPGLQRRDALQTDAIGHQLQVDGLVEADGTAGDQPFVRCQCRHQPIEPHALVFEAGLQLDGRYRLTG